MWWWVEPLFLTGFVLVLLSALIFITGMILSESNVKFEKITLVLTGILLIPFTISIVSALIWFMINIFKQIWSPYL